jgi:hypothetical protein
MLIYLFYITCLKLFPHFDDGFIWTPEFRGCSIRHDILHKRTK